MRRVPVGRGGAERGKMGIQLLKFIISMHEMVKHFYNVTEVSS